MCSRKLCSASIFTAFKSDWNSLPTGFIEYEYICSKFTYSPRLYPSIDSAKKTSVGPSRNLHTSCPLTKIRITTCDLVECPRIFTRFERHVLYKSSKREIQWVQRFEGRLMFFTLTSKRSDCTYDLKWVKRQRINAFCNINSVCSASRSCGIIPEHFKTRVNRLQCSMFLNLFCQPFCYLLSYNFAPRHFYAFLTRLIFDITDSVTSTPP